MNNIKHRDLVINESIFRRTFDERIDSLKKDILYSIGIGERINALIDIPGEMTPWQIVEFNDTYLLYFQCKLDIPKKFIKILNVNKLNQEQINKIVFQWKRYEKEISKGNYNLRRNNGNFGEAYKYVKTTLPLLNLILAKFEQLKDEFDIDINTEDKYTIYNGNSDHFYFMCKQSDKTKREEEQKKKNAGHANVDPFGEEQW